MTKVFVSVAMNGRSCDEIKRDIERAKKTCASKLGGDVEFADTFYGDDTESRECDGKKHPGLAYLGRSLKDMADCDIVFFCKGWDQARGCYVEKHAARSYGLLAMFEENL